MPKSKSSAFSTVIAKKKQIESKRIEQQTEQRKAKLLEEAKLINLLQESIVSSFKQSYPDFINKSSSVICYEISNEENTIPPEKLNDYQGDLTEVKIINYVEIQLTELIYFVVRDIRSQQNVNSVHGEGVDEYGKSYFKQGLQINQFNQANFVQLVEKTELAHWEIENKEQIEETRTRKIGEAVQRKAYLESLIEEFDFTLKNISFELSEKNFPTIFTDENNRLIDTSIFPLTVYEWKWQTGFGIDESGQEHWDYQTVESLYDELQDDFIIPIKGDPHKLILIFSGTIPQRHCFQIAEKEYPTFQSLPARYKIHVKIVNLQIARFNYVFWVGKFVDYCEVADRAIEFDNYKLMISHGGGEEYQEVYFESEADLAAIESQFSELFELFSPQTPKWNIIARHPTQYIVDPELFAGIE